MPYSATDAATRLAEVRDAIQKVLSGCQEYYVGTRRVRYASLGDLRKMEVELQNEAQNEASGPSMTSLVVYGGVKR
jgi:hypothetical protein